MMSSARFGASSENRHKLSYQEGAFKTTWLPAGKVQSFIKVFDYMSDRLGSQQKALDYIGFSHCTISNMREKRLSVASAKKLLVAYKKLKRGG